MIGRFVWLILFAKRVKETVIAMMTVQENLSVEKKVAKTSMCLEMKEQTVVCALVSLIKSQNVSQCFLIVADTTCSLEAPCDRGQGHCDSNSECKAGLVCGTENCMESDTSSCCVDDG